MRNLQTQAVEFFANLRQLTEGDVSSSWMELCILMTKLGAIISAGLFLIFAAGIALGFGHEITLLKLFGGVLVLVAWPFGMGLMIGTACYLHQRWRRFVHRKIGQKNRPNQS